MAVNFKDGGVTLVVTKSGGVLSGTIVAFSGTFESGYPVDKNTGKPDKEWRICDGTNGTPDLRGRFLLGGDEANTGATGGEEKHTLTEPELPRIEGSWNTAVIKNHGTNGVTGYAYGAVFGNMLSATYTENTQGYGYGMRFGNNQPHNNMPPYYTLAYIMRL